MNLMQWLESDQARDAVIALLSGKPVDPIINAEMDLVIDCVSIGAWDFIRIHESIHGREIRAYFRMENQFYVVTDIGEGIHKLRQRTGQLWSWHNDPYSCMPKDHSVDLLDRFVVCKVDAAGRCLTRIEILPSAICAVLLASLKVSMI